jgi:hypothetical protein
MANKENYGDYTSYLPSYNQADGSQQHVTSTDSPSQANSDHDSTIGSKEHITHDQSNHSDAPAEAKEEYKDTQFKESSGLSREPVQNTSSKVEPGKNQIGSFVSKHTVLSLSVAFAIGLLLARTTNKK